MQTEDEQLKQLKNWWNSNGKSIFAGVLLALALTGGWRYFQHYQSTQKNEAAILYQQILNAYMQEKVDEAVVVEQITALTRDYANLGYAHYANLLRAKIAIDNNQVGEAIDILQALLNKNYDPNFNEMVRIRLSKALIEVQKYDEALQVLNVETNNSLYKAMKAGLRGDIFIAQNNLAKAREEYLFAHNLAINETGLEAFSIILQMKLDDLAIDES